MVIANRGFKNNSVFNDRKNTMYKLVLNTLISEIKIIYIYYGQWRPRYQGNPLKLLVHSVVTKMHIHVSWHTNSTIHVTHPQWLVNTFVFTVDARGNTYSSTAHAPVFKSWLLIEAEVWRARCVDIKCQEIDAVMQFDMFAPLNLIPMWACAAREHELYIFNDCLVTFVSWAQKTRCHGITARVIVRLRNLGCMQFTSF